MEQAFNAIKNELENGKSYPRDNDSIRRYFFLSLYYICADLSNRLH
ncbi:MAG: hypothetical protein QXZ17_07930 [Nitrososphaerota archaeon]